MSKGAASAIIDPIGTTVRKAVGKGQVGDALSPVSAAVDPSDPGAMNVPGTKPDAINVDKLAPQDVATRDSPTTTYGASYVASLNDQGLMTPAGNKPQRRNAASRTLGSTF